MLSNPQKVECCKNSNNEMCKIMHICQKSVDIEIEKWREKYGNECFDRLTLKCVIIVTV